MVTDTYPQILTSLVNARNEILLLINEENKSMIDKISMVLTKEINALSVFTGNAQSVQTQKANIGAPSKTIMGKKVVQQQKPEKPIPLNIKQHIQGLTQDHDERVQTQVDVEFLEIEKQRDELYDVFTEMQPADIKDSKSELLIRGVAKKAGIPVTNNLPEKITTEFIKQVQDAIKKIKEQSNPKVTEPITPAL